MLYLSGAAVNSGLPAEVGVIVTPMQGYKNVPNGRLWGADTGCFGQPERHDNARYLSWLLDRKHALDRCVFATAPDVVGDARATLIAAKHMLRVIRALGFPAALVAQDGLESLAVPWDTFDCLFIGGTTKWKLSEAAHDLMREAKSRGKYVHMGRVNSLRRLRLAALAGCDSADGTFVAFGTDTNIKRLSSWLQTMERQPSLWP